MTLQQKKIDCLVLVDIVIPSSWYQIHPQNEQIQYWTGTNSYQQTQQTINLMWFILSEAISLYIYIYICVCVWYIYIYIYIYTRRYCGTHSIHSWARWLNHQKLGVKPLFAHIPPDLPGNIGLNSNQTTDQRVTNGNMRNDGRFS